MGLTHGPAQQCLEFRSFKWKCEFFLPAKKVPQRCSEMAFASLGLWEGRVGATGCGLGLLHLGTPDVLGLGVGCVVIRAGLWREGLGQYGGS